MWRAAPIGLLAAAAAVAVAVLVVAPATPRWSSAWSSSGGGDVTLPSSDAGAGRTQASIAPDAQVGSGVRCHDGAECLAWEHPVEAGDPALADVEIGIASVAIATAGELTLVDAWTGAPRWSQPVALSQPPTVALAEGLVVATGAFGGLVVHASEDGRPLTARATPAATSGEGALTQARRYDGRLAVVRAPETGGQQLVVVDVATGTSASVSHRAAHVALTRAGPVLHLGAGRLEGRDAVAGSTRWTAELAWEPAEVVALGDTVVALGHDELALLSAETGAPLLGEGELPTDGFATIQRPGEGLLVTSGSRLRFVDRSGATWEAPLPGGCCRGMRLTEDVVTVLLEDGRTLAFARADGSPRPTAAGVPPVPARAVLLDGGLVVEPQDGGGWNVTDARTSHDLAAADGALVGSTRDGALVVWTGSAVVAIARPDHAEPPRRYGFSRRCSSGAPGGCGFGG